MRVLVLSNFYPPLEIGGWEQLTRDTVHGLRRRGHAVTVLTSRHRRHEAPDGEMGVERSLHLESPDLARYHPRYALRRAAWLRSDRRRLRAAVARFEPDVAFVHGMWNLPVELAREAERALDGRVVYWVASEWATEVGVPAAYWRLPAARAWLGGAKRTVARWELRRLDGGASAADLGFPRVLCVSRYIEDRLRDSGLVDAERLFVVHNGVDLDRFRFRGRDPRDRALELLYAGRLAPEKGVETLLEAMARMRGTERARLSIVGAGEDADTGRLRRRIDELGIGASVELVPWVAADRMPEVMAEHDVLLLPSVWAEPLARVAQEGMASGLVVVGTTQGGMGELLEDGVTGLTFPPGDADALAGAILRLANDTTLFSCLATAGRSRVEARFSEARMIDEMERHLLAVADPTGAGGGCAP